MTDIKRLVKDDSVKTIEEEIASKSVKKKLRTKKIRMSMTNAEEKKLDMALEKDNNVSVAFMIIILVVCFVVGISLGYILYRIALNGTI